MSPRARIALVATCSHRGCTPRAKCPATRPSFACHSLSSPVPGQRLEQENAAHAGGTTEAIRNGMILVQAVQGRVATGLRRAPEPTAISFLRAFLPPLVRGDASSCGQAVSHFVAFSTRAAENKKSKDVLWRMGKQKAQARPKTASIDEFGVQSVLFHAPPHPCSSSAPKQLEPPGP